jgi:anti-anti-sigma regulatory factor
MLVAAARAVEDDGGTFVVCAASAAVRRVIDILHLDQVVRVVETPAEAVAAIRDGAPGEVKS